MKNTNRFSARTARPRPRDYREMLSWPDADLQRVETVRRELVSQGIPRPEAGRRAAEQVRRERHARKNQW